MSDGGEKVLVLLIVLSFVVGLLVIAFNKDYRPDKILKSNKYYYPTVKETNNLPDGYQSNSGE